MSDRGTTRKERMLLAIGIVVVAVWFGLFAWFAQFPVFTSPAPSFSIGFGTAMALVPSAVMILLVGFAIQITHKRPRVLFASFVVFQVASLALSLVVQTFYINSLSPITNFQNDIQVIGTLSLALVITSAVATLLLLLLALPARRPVWGATVTLIASQQRLYCQRCGEFFRFRGGGRPFCPDHVVERRGQAAAVRSLYGHPIGGERSRPRP